VNGRETLITLFGNHLDESFRIDGSSDPNVLQAAWEMIEEGIFTYEYTYNMGSEITGAELTLTDSGKKYVKGEINSRKLRNKFVQAVR